MKGSVVNRRINGIAGTSTGGSRQISQQQQQQHHHQITKAAAAAAAAAGKDHTESNINKAEDGGGLVGGGFTMSSYKNQSSGDSKISSAALSASSKSLSNNSNHAANTSSSVSSTTNTTIASSSQHRLNPSGRIVLLCVQNALKMGSRTQLLLCPPGRCRQSLQASLHHRIAQKQQQLQNMSHLNNVSNHSVTATTTMTSSSTSANSGSSKSLLSRSTHHHRMATNSSSTQLLLDPHAQHFKLEFMIGAERLEEYEVLEEDYLINNASAAAKAKKNNNAMLDDDHPNDSDYDDDEVASSGDSDELVDINYMFSDEPIHLDDDSFYNLTNNQSGAQLEPLYTSSSTNDHNNMNNGSNNPNGTNKLPFNRKKIRYFDQITAEELVVTRAYLKTEYRRSKKRMHTELCQQIIRQVNTNITTETTTATTVTTSNSVYHNSQKFATEKSSSKTTTETGNLTASSSATTRDISLFDHPMTPAMAASLLLESMCINPIESIEGMAKCYEGIVAAGVALLDTPDPTQPFTAVTNRDNTNSNNKTRRSKIMAALAPLLITSLEQPSGEVILLLAKLRRMCGTVRYRRRFVQRIAPALVRPPDGSAMWCLKHQNDMIAIFAATELILDAAFDVFNKGWYERGRWMLADSKRAETLSVAAKQLQNLSQESPDSLTFSAQRNNNHRHHHHRRLKNDHNLDEPLAEWEVIAVDRQIRISISSVFHTDWARAAIHETVPRPTRQRALSNSGSSSNPRPRQQGATIITADMSPRTPRSPRGASGFGKAPASPLSESSMMSSAEPPFGMPFTTTSNNSNNNERSQTPPPPLTPFTNNAMVPDNELSPRQQQHHSSMPQLPRSPKSLDRNLELSPRHILSKDATTGNTGSHNDNKINTGITPISPSASSVGSASENINAFQHQQHKPNTVGSMTLTSATGPSTAHYRMLTSTAAERKRTVAACRALRAQIQRFEDAFVQLHGRPPKGAGDRAPLATTYAQYREWKRAIRADAACRIQALFRGSRCRWSLLRTNNAKITLIVRKRAGRASSISTIAVPAMDNTTTINDKIAIPFEIEDSKQITSPESSRGGAVISSLSPQWANQLVPPRINFGGSPNDTLNNDNTMATSSSPRLQQVSDNSSPSSSPTDQSPDSTFINMSFAELQARKRDLKQQLKQYDMNFARKHGRMPVKSEKEPIRHLYESYNTLKSQITDMERDGKHLPGGSNQQQQLLQPLSLTRQISPTSGSDSGTDESVPSSNKVDIVSPIGSAARAKRKLPKPGMTSPPLISGGGTNSSTGSGIVTSIVGVGGGTSGINASGQPDLTVLKAEKQNLHTMLRSFEKDFFRENRRQVSSFADIRPVASQYRRYKEIKKQITSLQQQSGSSSSSDR